MRGLLFLSHIHVVVQSLNVLYAIMIMSMGILKSVTLNYIDKSSAFFSTLIIQKILIFFKPSVSLF